MKKPKNLKVWTGCILLAAGFLFLLIAKLVPGFAEWYAQTIYPIVSGGISWLSGLLPLSVTEVCIYILLMLGSIIIFRKLIRIGRKKVSKLSGRVMASNMILGLGILFFLFVFNCGINYHRKSFSEFENIQTRVYTTDDLKKVSMYLAEQVNIESDKVLRDESGTMILPEDAGQIAVEAMQSAAESFSSLEGYYPRPKWLLMPEILSYQSITGIYSPFTVEANYNNDITDYNIPFTMCHELSHLRGFMQEQEANFIAYLACIGSTEEAFRYSGNMLAFIYCTNVLRKESYDDYEEVRLMLNEYAEKDLNSNSSFWAKYDGRIAEVSSQINDTYLKANGQSDGVKSYDRMVDLVVSYYYLMNPSMVK